MKEVINSRAAMCDSSLRELEAKQVRDTIARQMHTGQGKQEWKKTISLIVPVEITYPHIRENIFT